MPLRVALLEIDHWHIDMYADALAQLPVRVVAVSDLDHARAHRLANEIGCKAYPSAEDLLDRETVDFAFAFAPHSRMFRLAKLLVEHNVPFAMEKPISLNVRELATLLPRIEGSEMFAQVAFVRRMGGFGGALLAMREEFGEMQHFHGRFIGGPMRRYVEAGCPWMLHKETAGGGCMINFGTHFFDLFLELTQEPIKRVFCQTSNKLHGHSVEDVASVLMQTHSGANATLESGYLLPDDPKEDIISLSAKNAYAGNDKKRWSFPTITFRDGRVSRVLEDEPTYGDYVEETIRRFEADEKPIANVRSMVRVLDCVNAAYESARTGQPVSPLNEWW